MRGRAAVGDLCDEGDLLGRTSSLAAELLGPADANPAVTAHRSGEFVVVAPFIERLLQVCGLFFRRPMLSKPGTNFLSERFGGRTHVVGGKRGHTGPNTRSASSARARGTPPKRARSACTRRKCLGASCSSA